MKDCLQIDFISVHLLASDNPPSSLEKCIYFGAFVHMAAPSLGDGRPTGQGEVAELVVRKKYHCIYDAVMFQLLLARRTAVTKRSSEPVLCFSTLS